MSDPLWLPDVLRDAGLPVYVADGAINRGHGDMLDLWGVVCHHTGSDNASWQSIAFHPSLGLASQLHLSFSGMYTLCGVGIAWHAGPGSWPGLPTNNANPRTIGIEAANDGGGRPGRPHRMDWPAVQYDHYVMGVAAILRHENRDSSRAIGHKDWAGAAQGKWDPGGIDMNIFRSDVQSLIGGGPISAPTIPLPGERIVLMRGDRGSNVQLLTNRLRRNYSRLTDQDYFGEYTERCVKDYQATRKPPLVPDGIVGPITSASLGLSFTVGSGGR